MPKTLSTFMPKGTSRDIVSVSLLPDVRAALVAAAERENVSRSSIIERMIQTHLMAGT